MTAGSAGPIPQACRTFSASCSSSVRFLTGMRFWLANAAMRRTFRSTSAPTSVRLASLLSSRRRRRAANTVTTRSLSSGTRLISASIASRGTAINRLGSTARAPIMWRPPFRNAISPKYCPGPSVASP